MNYIKILAVTEKLRTAEKQFRPVFISAPVGYGKTAAVLDFYNRRSILVLSGISGTLSDMPEISAVRQGVVLIDDVSFIEDKQSEEYIKSLLTDGSKQIIVAGRGKFPAFLVPVSFNIDFVYINENDFIMSTDQIRKALDAANVNAAPETLDEIAEATQGYPVAAFLYAHYMSIGREFDAALVEQIWEDIFYYFDESVFDNLDDELSDIILGICCYDEFTPEFAEFVTGSRNANNYIDYLIKTGQMILRTGNGTFMLRDEVKKFLMWKRKRVFSREKDIENYRQAAYYYKTHNNIYEALKYYRMAGADEQIKEILIKNASLHPGVGHYYETREFYYSLSEQTILENPTLIAGMSMLCSLMLDSEGAEKWYNKLKEYERDRINPKGKRRKARGRIAYLDIALPHRAGTGIIKIIHSTFNLILNNEIKLPEFSVTSNIPSIMNGGLDFCKWSKNDTDIARFMAKPLEAVLGKYSKGIVNIALAESGFEKRTIKPYEVLTRLINGISEADNGGKTEMVFAATGLVVKQHIIEGQLPTALRRAQLFGQRIKEENATQLFLNYEAFMAWLALYAGDMKTVHSFLENAPDERTDFYVLDRYRYMIKIRCLIAEERLTEAITLSAYLTDYFEKYKRHYLTIENEILKSIILYRMADKTWRRALESAIKKAEEYHFVRVFSLEGAAIAPLLYEIEDIDTDKKFLTVITNEATAVSLNFPDYLRYEKRQDIHLTAREQEVLSLLCRGLSMQEISDKCGISYSGIKKHNNSIYKKLGVKTRAEAERTAIKLGIIQQREE